MYILEDILPLGNNKSTTHATFQYLLKPFSVIFPYLILYNTEPYGNILMYTFGIIMLWKCPSFSLEKNKSGIHTLFDSVSVKYFIFPKKIWKLLVLCID